jgi:ATP phosphoribosyltransferase regulatory subunit
VSDQLEQALYGALQSKDQTLVRELTADLDARTRDALCSLTELNGGLNTLEEARKRLPSTQKISQALDDLKQVGTSLIDLGVDPCFDLSELRGYHYHSGIVFAAYAQGYAGPLALGGRYDEVGSAFGRARPATGFSLDLRGVVTALPPAESKPAIIAPNVKDAALYSKIDELRASGEVVIQELPGHEAHRTELNCDRQLVKRDNGWQVVAL